MSWTVQVCKPGRDPFVVTLPHLGVRVLRPVAYRTGLFVEEYEPTRVHPSAHTCVVTFSRLRRLDELARVFDPTRLPA